MSNGPSPVSVSETAARLTDFSDWLSPMLVKELRQGLRSRVFVVAFVLLQATLCLVLLFSVDGHSNTSSYFFWLVSAVLIVGAMPLRGFTALSDEVEDKTLDLLMITRLSSLRIAFGKWCALVVQTLLLGITLLPYVIIRYFLGGVDLALELVVLAYLLMLSCVLTALTVAFSVYPSFLVRFGLVLTAGTGAALLIETLLNFHSLPRDFLLLKNLLATVLASGYACWFLLELGATRIAPTAENHALRKRLASLIIVGMLVVTLSWQWRELILGLALLSAIDALSEPNNTNRSVLIPFVRWGVFGKWLGRLLYPGWSSGVVFALVLSAVMILGDARLYHRSAGETEFPLGVIIEWIAWPAAVLLPVPVLWWLSRGKAMENRFVAYMIVQSAVGAVCFGILLIATSTKQHLMTVAALVVPQGMLAAAISEKSAALDTLSPEVIMAIASTSCGIVLLASIVAGWRGFHSVREAEKLTRESIDS